MPAERNCWNIHSSSCAGYEGKVGAYNTHGFAVELVAAMRKAVRPLTWKTSPGTGSFFSITDSGCSDSAAVAVIQSRQVEQERRTIQRIQNSILIDSAEATET
jgi:hypothetical protein